MDSTKVSKPNENGTYDIGLMQINSSWLPKLKSMFGIAKTDLMDACTNVKVAAWLLNYSFTKHGNTWKAVGAYNSPTPKHQLVYVKKVNEAYESIEQEQEEDSDLIFTDYIVKKLKMVFAFQGKKEEAATVKPLPKFIGVI